MPDAVRRLARCVRQRGVARLEDELDRFAVAHARRRLAGDHAARDRGLAHLVGVEAAAVVLEQQFEAARRQRLELEAQRALRGFARGGARGGGLDAVHDRIADELDGDVLDGGLIRGRNELQTQTGRAVMVLLALLRTVSVSARSVLSRLPAGADCWAPGTCLGAVDLVRDAAQEFRRLDDLGAVLRHAAARAGEPASRGGGAAPRTVSDLMQGELAVELVQLDRERQEVAAAQRAAAAQLVQGILEQARGALQGRGA